MRTYVARTALTAPQQTLTTLQSCCAGATATATATAAGAARHGVMRLSSHCLNREAVEITTDSRV